MNPPLFHEPNGADDCQVGFDGTLASAELASTGPVTTDPASMVIAAAASKVTRDLRI
jgi:hypothetical protein